MNTFFPIANARLRWHLHKQKVKILGPFQLARIWQVLHSHHSRDPTFLRVIQFEMASKEELSWRCKDCYAVMKGAFRCCWNCGQKWQACEDTTFTPPELINQQKQREAQHAARHYSEAGELKLSQSRQEDFQHLHQVRSDLNEVHRKARAEETENPMGDRRLPRMPWTTLWLSRTKI